MNHLRLLVLMTLTCSLPAQRDHESSAPTRDGPTATDLAPADALLTQIAAEIEALRFWMGRPRHPHRAIRAERAPVHAAYHQARSLAAQAKRLRFEHLRDVRSRRATLPRQPGPNDLSAALTETLQHLRAVREFLGATTPTAGNTDGASHARSHADMFAAIVDASRQLNLLLDAAVAPGEVFREVTQAVAFTTRILNRFPSAEALPEPPAFEAGRTPAHVHERLRRCMSLLRRITARSGVESLELSDATLTVPSPAPSDVLLVATMITGELATLHDNCGDTQAARLAPYAGRRFPSHVFQRAGLLERQLTRLSELTEQDADWWR